MFPPVYEKDQRETEKAVSVLREFIEKHPQSTHLAEAQKTLAQAQEMLAKRELFVGDYYFKRGYWAGAAGRYKGLAETYPDAPQARAGRAQAGAGLRAHGREVPGPAGAAAPHHGAPGEPGARRGGEAP